MTLPKIDEEFEKKRNEIKEQILEWDKYLPEVKRQSIDVLVDNIVEIFN